MAPRPSWMSLGDAEAPAWYHMGQYSKTFIAMVKKDRGLTAVRPLSLRYALTVSALLLTTFMPLPCPVFRPGSRAEVHLRGNHAQNITMYNSKVISLFDYLDPKFFYDHNLIDDHNLSDDHNLFSDHNLIGAQNEIRNIIQSYPFLSKHRKLSGNVPLRQLTNLGHESSPVGHESSVPVRAGPDGGGTGMVLPRARFPRGSGHGSPAGGSPECVGRLCGKLPMLRGGRNLQVEPPPRRSSYVPISWINSLYPWKYLVFTLAIFSLFTCMMPAAQGQGRGENFSYRMPPAWSPEQDHSYSFRAYMTDLSLWVMLTDLAPHQQAAAIIMRLGGQARELARMISPQELMGGGVRNGQLLDPVTYLLGALQMRFSNLDEETRLLSMTEMLAFARRPGENINAMLARYEVVRQRAANEGRFVMSIEDCALQVLRAAGTHPNQLTINLEAGCLTRIKNIRPC